VDATEIVSAVRQSFSSAPPPDDLSTATVGDDYRGTYASGTAGIRVSHAQAALKDADAVEAFAGEETHHVLVRKQVQVSRPFDMVLQLYRREGVLFLAGGWRVYDAPSATTPLELFASVIDRFGLAIRFGGLAETNFLPQLTVPQFSGDPSQLMEVPTSPGRPVSVSCLMRMAPTGDMHLEWGYAIDIGRYQSTTAYERA
jgi:hypothetical protein